MAQKIAFLAANREQLPDPVIPIGLLYVMASTPKRHPRELWDLCFAKEPIGNKGACGAKLSSDGPKSLITGGSSGRLQTAPVNTTRVSKFSKRHFRIARRDRLRRRLLDMVLLRLHVSLMSVSGIRADWPGAPRDRKVSEEEPP